MAGSFLICVYKDDQDRINFSNTLQHVSKRYNRICHVYCLKDKKIIELVKKYGYIQ